MCVLIYTVTYGHMVSLLGQSFKEFPWRNGWADSQHVYPDNLYICPFIFKGGD